MGRAHEKGLLMPLFVLQKIIKFMYNLSRMGNTIINQINNSTAKNQKFGQYNYTYLVLIKEDFPHRHRKFYALVFRGYFGLLQVFNKI